MASSSNPARKENKYVKKTDGGTKGSGLARWTCSVGLQQRNGPAKGRKKCHQAPAIRKAYKQLDKT